MLAQDAGEDVSAIYSLLGGPPSPPQLALKSEQVVPRRRQLLIPAPPEAPRGFPGQGGSQGVSQRGQELRLRLLSSWDGGPLVGLAGLQMLDSSGVALGVGPGVRACGGGGAVEGSVADLLGGLQEAPFPRHSLWIGQIGGRSWKLNYVCFDD